MGSGAGRQPPLMARRASFVLTQLGAHVAGRFAGQLAPLGLQPSHFGLLNHVRRGEGQSQQQLADALGVHRRVMVGLVDDLEARDLVERRGNGRDRRAHALFLTPGARALLDRADQVAEAVEAELLAPLGAADRDRLTELLYRLASHAGLASGIHPNLRAAPPPACRVP